MPEHNPYAPPTSTVTDASQHSDDLDFDIVEDQIQSTSPLWLPTDLCVGCGANGTAGKTYDKKIYYVPWPAYLTIFFNLLIMLIVVMVVRKKLEVTYHLCEHCVSKRKKRMLIGAGVCVALLLGIPIGVALDSGVLALLSGFGLIIALLVLAVLGSPPLKARKHQGGLFSVKGASPEFYDQVARRRPDGSINQHW